MLHITTQTLASTLLLKDCSRQGEHVFSSPLDTQTNKHLHTISISSPPIIPLNYSSQTILPASLKKFLVKVTSGFYFDKTNAKPLAFILLELSGVFDKVHHTLLLEKLSSCEFWDTIHLGSLVIRVTSTQFLL